jgi:uncharacterized membrane protein
LIEYSFDRSAVFAAGSKKRGPEEGGQPVFGALEKTGGSMLILMMIYILGGSVLILLAIPLILRKVPPNTIYGFRVRWTSGDPELWFSVNAYTGKWLAFVGACAILSALGLALIPGISFTLYAFACLVTFIATFGIGMLQSIRFLRKMDSQK